MADYQRCNIGVIGDNAHVEGGIHFHGDPSKPPLQLPPKHDNFIGRQEKIADLIASLAPGHITALWGPGGIGKSAIASEVLHKITDGGQHLPDDFPDGLIWHDFYRTPSADAALEQIALTFSEEPRPTPQDAAKRALSGKKVLLLLDGAEATDLNRVLETAAACAVIVTTRNREGVSDRREIETLPPQDAEALLQAWAGDMAQDPEPLSQICQLVGNLPLALRLAGAYMGEEKEPAAQYLKWLKNTTLEALDFGERKEQSVSVLLKKSLDQVSNQAAAILSIAGVLAVAPFAREPVAAALDVEADELRKPFRELTGYALLVRSDDRYTLSHALVGTFARENHPPPDPAVERLAVFFTAFAEKHSKHGPEGYARLDTDRPLILQTLTACHARNLWEPVGKLVWAIHDFLDIKGHWRDLRATLHAGIEAARALKNRYDEGAHLNQLGLAYSHLGQLEKAIDHYQQALAISMEIGDLRGEGNDLCNLGSAYSDLGQVEKAIEHYQQALTIFREIGDRKSEGVILGNLGNVYNDLGQVEEAMEHYNWALTIAREIGDRRSEGNHLGNLGLAYSALYQVEKAIEHYEQALAISREIEHRSDEGRLLAKLSMAYRSNGQVEKALKFLEQSQEIFEEINDSHANILKAMTTFFKANPAP